MALRIILIKRIHRIVITIWKFFSVPSSSWKISACQRASPADRIHQLTPIGHPVLFLLID